MQNVKLYNGVEMPMEGFGVFQVPENECKEVVLNAIRIGYRLIDTASSYKNEEAVGAAIRAAEKEGIAKRNELFIATKAYIQEMGYENLKKAFARSLQKLGLDYLDLYLIHWPANEKQFGDRAAQINADSWRAMEELYEVGRIRAIGLSNFMPHHVKKLMETARIKPMVDQIEVHPGWPHTDEIIKLQDMGILVEAWGPLGGQGSVVLQNPTMKKIAEAHGKSTAQVSLRWIIQQGVLPLPKSVHVERIRQNMDLFDFELSDDEMKEISSLSGLGGQCADPDDVDF